jgi:hypothetical protein
MKRRLLKVELEKKNPGDEQNHTLGRRYPKARFVMMPELADVTLSALVIEVSEKVRAEKPKDCWKLWRFLKAHDLLDGGKLTHDFLIEAVKNNHYELVKLVTGKLDKINPPHSRLVYYVESHVIEVTKRMLEDTNSININHTMEVILCAQDTPTEVLKIIDDMNPNKCIDLLLNNYFYCNIYRHLERAEILQASNSTNSGFFEQRPIDYVNAAITNIKFLCHVIENNYLNKERFESLIADITATVYKYKDLICEYPQAIKELPSILNLTKLMEQDKGDAQEVSRLKIGKNG